MTPEEQIELCEAFSDKVASKPKSIPQQLVSLALAEYEFLRGTDGQPYAVLKEGVPFAQALRGENSFRKQLSRRFHKITGMVASAGALADSLLILEAHADEADPVEVYQRLAPIDGGVLLDLGNPASQVVEATSTGWTVRSARRGDPLFKRSRAMGVMPVPRRGGSLELFWRLLNIREADRALLQAWIAATFLPWAQPLLLFRGEQGTGKSTAAKMLLSLVDPGPGQMAAPPRNDRDWGVTATGRIALGLDNLSSVSPWLSDALCRAVTGEALVGRELYTNEGLSILRFRIALIVTSIDPGALRGDLAERTVPIELEPLGDGRRSERQILDDFEALVPSLLGAVLDLVVLVMRHHLRLEMPNQGWPRMADFAVVLGALDLEFGTDALAAYMQLVADNDVDAVDGDPLADAIIGLVQEEDGFWEGNLTELFNKLPDYVRSEMHRGWRTPQQLSATLTRLTKGLRSTGLVVERRKSGSKRLISLTMTTGDT